MYIKSLWVVVLALFTSIPLVQAATKQPIYESPLTPGARLLAGDLTKNEFFILGKDEPNPVGISQKRAPQVASVKEAKQKPSAASKPIALASVKKEKPLPTQLISNKKEKQRAIQLANNKKEKRMPIQVATKMATKKELTKAIRVAVNKKEVNKAYARTNKRVISKVDMIEVTRIAINKPNSKIKKSILYQSPAKAGSKKRMTTVKTVLKKTPQKLTRKKVTARVAMLNETKHKVKKTTVVKA